MSKALDEARRLLREGYAAEAITHTTEAPSAEALDVALVRARALMSMERFDEAFGALTVFASRKDVPESRRAEHNVVRGRLMRRTMPLIDDAIDLLQSGARLASRLPPAARDPIVLEATLELARAFGRKRTRELADAEIRRAMELAPKDPDVLCTAAEVLVDFDDRPNAVERYRAACALGPAGERKGRAGWANVAMLLGQFDEAHAHLNALGTPRSGEPQVRRTRVRLLTAQQRWSDVVAVYDEMARANPKTDYSEHDAYERATAMYRSGWFPHALAAFDTLGKVADKGYYVELARRCARLLARPDITQKRWRRLPAFPTVAQLRDHCGPASCELYLRYFGVPASQIEVARAVKEPDSGTPVYRMRRFLEQAGFHARRIEAELPMLRRLIDVGVPVIMEERYAQSGHVAVAVGYDDIREVLEVQDPMSHEIRETRYEELAKLRDFSNHGALIAVPRHDLARIATLDQVGAVECQYIALIDQAWALQDEGKLEEADRCAEQSLALRRDYELTWFYKFERAMDRAGKSRGGEAQLELFKIAAEVAAIWPDQDWPEKLRGQALASDGRFAEALTALERARERDPDDARTWAQIGACQVALGRKDDAFESLKQALRRNPSHPTANARLADLCFERGDLARASQLCDAARRLAPNFALTHDVHGRILMKRKDDEGATAAFRRALALDPARVATMLDCAKCQARVGRIDDAVQTLEAGIKGPSSEGYFRGEIARLLFENGQPQRAMTIAKAALSASATDAHLMSTLGACQLATGDHAAGIATLRAALALAPTASWIYTQMGRHFTRQGEHAHAIEAFATALGLSRDPRVEYELGLALSAGGYAAQAADRMMRAAEAGELTEAELVRVGEAVVAAKEAAKPFFERVLAKRPDDPEVLRAYARTMLELNWGPSIAMPLLARLSQLVPNDPYALAYRGSDDMDHSLDTEARGETLLTEAVAKLPEREYPRRALADRLTQRGRYEEALTLLAPCKMHYQVMRLRVRALIGLDRLDAVNEQFAAFESAWGKPGKESFGVRTLKFELAMRKMQYAEALALAEQLSKEEGEREDDGRLDAWEFSRCECLARLGELDRALKFGERQALDAVSLGRLGLLALDIGVPSLAGELAQRALRLVADNPAGVFIRTRLSELAGDAGAPAAMAALAAKEKGWYRPHAAMVKMALALGDLATAEKRSSDAVAMGHLYVESFVARAQHRAAVSDRAGAAKDLERAWAIAKPESRERDHADGWALRSQLQGDYAASEALYARYVAGPASPLDRSRVGKLRALR